MLPFMSNVIAALVKMAVYFKRKYFANNDLGLQEKIYYRIHINTLIQH